MREATAIAERYRELGFRVIEGGKSGKRVVIDSLHLGKKFDKNHPDVLDSIDKTVAEIKSHKGNFLHEISDDVRLSTYFVRGRPFRYYLLTETGFELVASGWDAVLRYELLIAFRELREGFGLQHSRPVADRLQQLRGDWTQGELFPAPTSVPKVQPRQSGRWVDDELPYDYRYKPTGHDAWGEIHAGTRYLAQVTRKDGTLRQICVTFANLRSYYNKKCHYIPYGSGQVPLVWDWEKTPRAVIDSVLDRLGINTRQVFRLKWRMPSTRNRRPAEASNVRWLPVWRQPLVTSDLVAAFAEIDEMKRVLAERDRIIRRESVCKCLKPRDGDGEPTK